MIAQEDGLRRLHRWLEKPWATSARRQGPAGCPAPARTCGFTRKVRFLF